MKWLYELIGWVLGLLRLRPKPVPRLEPMVDDVETGWNEEDTPRDDPPTVPTPLPPVEQPETLPAPEETTTMDELRGKAVFIRQIRHIDTNPIEAARKYAGWGFTWAAPMITTSDGGKTNRQIEFYRELHKLGVRVVPDWIRPKPGSWRGAIDDFFAFVDQLPLVRAVMFDPEEHWNKLPDEAEEFAQEFKARAKQRGLKVILTTYAVPPKHFPMEQFAAASDGGIAQTYYITSNFGDGIFALALSRWRSRGFGDKPVVLGAAFWQKYIENPRTKTPKEWAEFLAALPPTPGLVVWPNQSWGGPVAPLLPMLKDWHPAVVPAGALALLLGLPCGEMIANAIFGG